MTPRVVIPHNWDPRYYQIPLWQYFRSNVARKRAIAVWHRRAGKDITSMNIAAGTTQERVGTYWHLFPEAKQARAAIWNGITTEGRKYVDHFPRELINRTYEQEMRINFRNGSNYYIVGSDNFNSLIGTNPVGVILSEYSLQKPAAWQYLTPILAENGGWALFIYTFRGRNHGWFQAQMAKREGWFYDERYAGSGPGATRRPDGSPVVSDEEIEKLRREGIPESVIQSEFYNNPDAPIEGAYYSKEMQRVKAQGRIGSVPYDNRYPVYTAWDIGADMTVIIFFQLIYEEVRIIDCVFKTGEGLPYFVNELKKKPYDVYEKHFGPWDIDTREWAGGKSRMEIARNLGVNFTATPQKPSNAGVDDGIEQVRLLLGRCIFDQEKCLMLTEGLRSYRQEPDQEKMQFTGETEQNMTLFKGKPLHDWASHFADAMRTLAWNIVFMRQRTRNLPDKAEDVYQYT